VSSGQITPSFCYADRTLNPALPQPHHRFWSNQPRTSDRGGTRTEMSHEYALRCVHFPPSGIIVGGVNAQNEMSRGSGMSGRGMGFGLRLWDFDLEASVCD